MTICNTYWTKKCIIDCDKKNIGSNKTITLRWQNSNSKFTIKNKDEKNYFYIEYDIYCITSEEKIKTADYIFCYKNNKQASDFEWIFFIELKWVDIEYWVKQLIETIKQSKDYFIWKNKKAFIINKSWQSIQRFQANFMKQTWWISLSSCKEYSI